MSGWRPDAAVTALQVRARILAAIREFFRDLGVMEVDTPLLCSSGVTDPAIEPLIVPQGQSLASPRYLQTSPEYCMKRLLAAGSGPIFQIAHAFRDGEAGGRHNPEFSLLEWYRPGFDHHKLMDEVAALVNQCLGPGSYRRLSYRQLFLEAALLDPFTIADAELEATVRQRIDVGELSGNRDLWLDLLLTHVVEPWLRSRGRCFVYDYPASQAALAVISRSDEVPVAQRFELYVDGLELANGYHELTDPDEQRRRFTDDNKARLRFDQPERPLDERLLAALEAGLPPCSGVALGVDRLLLLATGSRQLSEVLAFSWQRS